MNLPAGTPLKTGLEVANVEFYALLKELDKLKFNGYVCLTVAGEKGFEEGAQIFDDGKPVASVYEYYKYRKTYYGEEAFNRVLNAAVAKEGIIDVFELSKEQVHLILAFNEKAINVPSPQQLAPRKLVHSPAYENQAASSLVPPTRDALLRKYKLADVKDTAESKDLEEIALDTDPLAELTGKK